MVKARMPDRAILEASIGHVFLTPSFLDQALTHVSALSLPEERSRTYQRLEFLGDRVLGLCVCDMLIEAHPDATEGDLSRRLAVLVRKETCADVASGWGAGRYVRLGRGEIASGGRKNQAILSDVCEAIIGAVFLDGGYTAARRVVERAFGVRMLNPTRPLRDAKSALQEWAQAQGYETPHYLIRDRSGPDHAPRFCIAATIAEYGSAEGNGASRRMAEQAAAEAFLRREGVWHDMESPPLRA